MNDENADSMKRESEVGLISSEVGRASSDRPESVVVSLLTLAAASLRPQGRVVFFYPHRHSRLTSGLTSMTMTSTTVPSVTSSNGPNNPTNNKIHKRKAFRDAMRQRQGLAQQQAQGLAQQQALGLAQQQAQGLAQDQPQERLNRTQEGDSLHLSLYKTLPDTDLITFILSFFRGDGSRCGTRARKWT